MALGALLLVVGVALPVASVMQRGAPWGFRGHRGVLVEVVGDVQVNDAEANRRDHKVGAWLEIGDELRAGRFSILRARLGEAELGVTDSGVVRLTQKGALFSSGALDVTVPTGPGKLVLEIEGFEQSLTVSPAGSDARVRVLADGKGAAFAHVRAGSVDASGTNVETGQLLTLRRGQAPKITPAPSSVELTATCDGAKVSLTASAGTQVFVPGFVRVSDGSKIDLDAPAGASRVVVSARDIAGNVARPQDVPCVKVEAVPEAPAPKPQPKPQPKPAPGGVVAPKPLPTKAVVPKGALPKPGAAKPAPANP
jgi:hypothetical protein